ncbi:MAG: metal ABC transporter permease [Candidatus Caldarchaeum sp.]|nr:metal ABC transporter permease [Candidatus Caldarchaeum sp.]MDW8360497.1 metal ABC transporter permease [Candidatus Caldarchaeum sp.]
MIDFFTQPFMVRGFAAAAVAGFTLPLLGVFLVPKKLSLLGDASSHVALASLMVAVFAGIPTGVFIYVFPVAAVYFMLVMMTRFKISGDQALVILLAMGATATSLAISFGARVSLSSVLFGSILLVELYDIAAGLGLALFVGLFTVRNFNQVVLFTVSDELAQTKGFSTNLFTLFAAVATGLSIVVGVKIAGVLLVTALLAIPYTASSLIATSLKKTILMSVAMGEASTVSGIFLSYFAGISPGAASVLIVLGLLAFSLVLHSMKIRI